MHRPLGRRCALRLPTRASGCIKGETWNVRPIPCTLRTIDRAIAGRGMAFLNRALNSLLVVLVPTYTLDSVPAYSLVATYPRTRRAFPTGDVRRCGSNASFLPTFESQGQRDQPWRVALPLREQDGSLAPTDAVTQPLGWRERRTRASADSATPGCSYQSSMRLVARNFA